MGPARRLLSTVLAAMLAVVMSMTVLAADVTPGTSNADTKGSITIINPQKGVTYSAYKIFDVTYAAAGDKTSYSYTIAGDSAWYPTVKQFADVTENKLTLVKAAGSDIYVVNAAEGFSSANFAKVLQGAVTGKTADVTGKLADDAAEDATLSLGTDLSLGYYLVMGTNAGLCSLDTTDPDAEVKDKNDMPFDKELTGIGDGTDTTPLPAPVDEYGVTVGSTLTYTITGEVPDTEGFEQYVYIAEDTMDAGLTMNHDVKLKIDGTEIAGLTSDTSGTIPTPEKNLAKGTVYYKGATAASGGGFVLRLDMKDYADKAGKKLEITYTAKVNENAVGVVSKNEAKLKYGNDPDDLTNGTPSEVRVFTSNIEVLKYAKNAVDAADTSKVLEGAEFVLQNSVTADDGTISPGGKYYKATITGDAPNQKVTKVEWVDSIDDATRLTTGSDGKAVFQGLENGTYYLVETKAPAGYNLLGANDKTDDGKITEKGEVKVVIATTIEKNADGSLTADPADFTVHEKVANSEGSLLPSTGGIGTTIFYIVGGVLLAAAVLWFVVSRRKAGTQK